MLPVLESSSLVRLKMITVFSISFFDDTATTEIYTLSLHDALPILGDAGIKSASQGSNVPNRDEAVPSFVSGAMAKAGKGLLEGTLQAGTSAVSDKLLDLVGLGGKSAADKGKDTRDYLAAAFPELNAWRRAGADASSAGMVDAGFENQKELTKMQLDNHKEIAEMQNETQKEIAGI